MNQQPKLQLTPAAIIALASGDAHNAATAMVPGGIEAQEAAGQATLVASSSLPREMHPDRASFETLGFVFGAPLDDLFLTATLPAGWTKKATEHAMTSDEQGRERVEVFYKAAFYDRRADMSLRLRYQFSSYVEVLGSPNLRAIHFTDSATGAVVRDFGTWDRSIGYDSKLENAAREQIALEFPDWRDPLAYW